MSKSKLYAWILSILGFQMQGCDFTETEEYGCPHTTFRTSGTVKDENGNYIQDAEVKVKIKAVNSSRPNDSETKANSSVISDNKGAYQTSDGKCDGINNYEKLQYEVITNKTGYKPDTIIKEIKKEDLKFKKDDSWKKSTNQEVNIVLKRK